MPGRRTFLSAGSVLMLIGVAAPAAVEAEAAADLQARSQKATRASTSATGDPSDQTADPLNRPVTLGLVDVPLGSALEAIARHAGFTLAYNAAVLPTRTTVTLDAAALPARDAIARVLDGTGLEPRMTRSGSITLAPLPESPAIAKDVRRDVPQQAVVTGTVTDAGTGEPLRGAQMRVDESALATTTDAEGRYTLEDVPPGVLTLVASMIGYGEARETVTATAGTTISVDFALTVSAVPLDELIVTGTMMPTQLRAVPSPVSVMTAEDIERRGAVRFEDILRSIPGVGVASNSTVDYLSYIYVRGATRTTGTNTIKTYVDGVEVANPLYTLNQIDPATIERIELIRGPQASALYGSEALAGVLQIFTKKGLVAQQTRIQATLAAGGMQSQYKDGLTLVQNHNIAITGGERNLSYSVGASYDHTGEWVEDELIDELGWDVDNSVVRDTDLSGGLRYVNGNLSTELSARVHGKSRGTPLEKALTDAARSGRLDYPYYTKPSGNENELNLVTYGITASYTPTSNWRHTFTIGHDASSMEVRQHQPRRTTPADTFLLFRSWDWTKRSLRYITALEAGDVNGIHSTFQAGFDRSSFSQRIIFVDDARQLQGGLGNTNADITRGSVATYGYFAQSRVSWRNGLFMTAGIRADQGSGFGDDYGTAWSPRVGITHTVDMGRLSLKSRAAYGKAIRSPEPQQMLGQTQANFVTLDNRSLAPEVQSGYDFGLELYVGRTLSAAVTRYDQIAKNLISVVRLSDPTAIPRIQQYQNVGRIRNTGWELEASVHLPPVGVRGHYSIMESTVEKLSPTYTGSRFIVGERTLDTPRSTGGFGISYELPRATVTLLGNYKGPWLQYEWMPYFEAIRGTNPDREPFTGDRRDYVIEYPSLWRYELNAIAELTPRIAAILTVDNLFNNTRSDMRDINLVRGRQVLVGIRFDSGR